MPGGNVSAIEKTMPGGLFWTHSETYQISGSSKDVQVCVWRLPRPEERRKTESTFFSGFTE